MYVVMSLQSRLRTAVFLKIIITISYLTLTVLTLDSKLNLLAHETSNNYISHHITLIKFADQIE